MFADLLNLDPISLGLVVLRTLAVYAALLIGFRLAGKRELGQMAPFDFVLLLLISNAVQNAMVGPDTSLTGGLLAAASLLAANWVVDRVLVRFGWLRKRAFSTPTLLIKDGELLRAHLAKEGLLDDEVFQALREHGVEDVAQVKLAVLEVDGTISVVPMDATVTRTKRRLRGRHGLL